jgi:hypothetical protein
MPVMRFPAGTGVYFQCDWCHEYMTSHDEGDTYEKATEEDDAIVFLNYPAGASIARDNGWIIKVYMDEETKIVTRRVVICPDDVTGIKLELIKMRLVEEIENTDG